MQPCAFTCRSAANVYERRRAAFSDLHPQSSLYLSRFATLAGTGTMAIFGKKRSSEKERTQKAAADAVGIVNADPAHINANASPGVRPSGRPGFMSRIVSHSRNESEPQSGTQVLHTSPLSLIHI